MWCLRNLVTTLRIVVGKNPTGDCAPLSPLSPFGLFRGIRDFWLTKPRKLNFRLRGIWLMNPGFAASERFNVRAGKGNSFPLTRDERSLFTGSELGGHSSLGLGSRRRAVNRLLKKFSLPFRGIHQPFFPNTLFGTITARRCGNGSPITYHIIEPTGSYDDFTNWFKNLAQYRNGQVGDVNVYKGQYIDNIYYWTSQKPKIFFSSEDLKILTPAAYEAYERAINSRIAALQASRPRADTNMMAKWKREFPVGTRICQSARSSGAPVLIPGIKIKGVLIGYVEAYADTKVKIRAVEHTAINNFKENTFWIFPNNKWYLCE